VIQWQENVTTGNRGGIIKDDDWKPETSQQTMLKLQQSTLDKHGISSKQSKEELDLALATFFFTTNTSFQRIEHPTFKSMISMLRPGHAPPSRKAFASELLDKVRESCDEKIKEEFDEDHNNSIVQSLLRLKEVFRPLATSGRNFGISWDQKKFSNS
jgi:hypothetical protein